jgi:hypothetical protein
MWQAPARRGGIDRFRRIAMPGFFRSLGLAEARRRQVAGRIGAPPMIDDTEKIGQADPGRQQQTGLKFGPGELRHEIHAGPDWRRPA